MKRRVYLETSVVSYLASRPSRDVVVAGRQQLTHTWWQVRRPAFDLVISQVVLDEVRAGDPDAAQRRLALIADLPSLDMTTAAAELAAILIERMPLPTQAAADAAHMAVAALHGVDFLMTWNVDHIANATLRRRVEDICREQGYGAPILCTPDELMEDPDVSRAWAEWWVARPHRGRSARGAVGVVRGVWQRHSRILPTHPRGAGSLRACDRDAARAERACFANFTPRRLTQAGSRTPSRAVLARLVAPLGARRCSSVAAHLE